MTAPDLDALGTRLTELHELAWRSPTGLEKAIAVGIVQELITTSQSLIAEVRELTRQNAEFAGTNTSLMNDLVQMGMARDEAERQRDEARAALVSLSAAETDYRHTHGLKGDGHILTGQAWDRMRRASHAARRALSALPPPAGSETGER